MSAGIKLLAFTLALAVVFGGAVVAGGAIDPEREQPAEEHDPMPPHAEDTTDEEHEDMSATDDQAHPVRGLGVAEDGLRVVADDPAVPRGETAELRFRVVDAEGSTVRDFDVEHDKRLHLIIVRRDLTGFQHLHPKQNEDGSWSAALRLNDAGSYRLFADFVRDGEPHTLATDLRVDGTADLHALPAPTAQAKSDGGYDVRLDAGPARPGAGTSLRFSITKDGRAIQTEPYLGAGGHLVALREGDLAFLHVHPTDDHGAIAFAATFPTQGRYRLFLQFQHDGRVHTAAFTKEVK